MHLRFSEVRGNRNPYIMMECRPAEVSSAAHSSVTSTAPASEWKIKCRKCRQQLLQQLEEVEEGAAADPAVYSLPEEGLPDWINAAIEEVSRLVTTRFADWYRYRKTSL